MDKKKWRKKNSNSRRHRTSVHPPLSPVTWTKSSRLLFFSSFQNVISLWNVKRTNHEYIARVVTASRFERLTREEWRSSTRVRPACTVALCGGRSLMAAVLGSADAHRQSVTYCAHFAIDNNPKNPLRFANRRLL